MIYIDRDKYKTPDLLSLQDGKGKKETNSNIEKAKNGDFDNFKFSVYREVKDDLIKLFKSKCAYCESKFLHVYSGDVEHFRPKGEILTKENTTIRPGYYWLASEWDNLLLSCRNCNQKLKHNVFGESKKRTMGKMNQFPLSDSDKYIKSEKQDVKEEEEYRLILDPCKDNPEKHIEFDVDTGVVRWKTEKGKRSIDVFVLQRIPLVQAREKLLKDVKAQIQRVKEAVKNVNDNLDSASSLKRIYFDKILKREMARLQGFVDPSSEFSAAAKQAIAPFLKDNFDITI